MIEVHGELSLQIIAKLVAPGSREVAYVMKSVGSPEFVQSAPDEFRPPRAMSPEEEWPVIAFLHELAIGEEDLQAVALNLINPRG